MSPADEYQWKVVNGDGDVMVYASGMGRNAER